MSYPELIIINAITGATLIVGSRLFISGDVAESETIMVTYDRANLLSNGSAELVVADLSARTGLDVEAVSIASLDLTTNRALLQVTHCATGAPASGSSAPSRESGVVGWRG
jgi:hypothetical protein